MPYSERKNVSTLVEPNSSDLEDDNYRDTKAKDNIVSDARNKVMNTSKKGFLSWILAGVLAFSVIYLLLAISRIKEYDLFVNGNKIANEESVYFEQIKSVENDNFFGNLKWFYRTGKLKDTLSTSTIEVSEVSKEVSIFDSKVTLNVTESRPSLIYTQADSNNRYLVDSEGIAYRQLSESQEVIDSVNIIDDTTIQIGENTQVFSPEVVDFVDQMNGFLQRDNLLRVGQYSVVKSQKLLTLSLKDKPYQIKLVTDRPAQSQYQAVIDTINHTKDEDIEIKQYIDVRVDGQSVYL